jgi:hypothetical protein
MPTVQPADDLSEVAEPLTSQSLLIRDQIREALASGVALCTKELCDVCPAALDAISVARQIHVLRKNGEIDPVDDPAVPVRRWRLRGVSAPPPTAQPKRKSGRPPKTAPAPSMAAPKAASPVLVTGSAIRPPTAKPSPPVPASAVSLEPKTASVPEPPPQPASDPITAEVFAAVHRRAHALSLAHYDRLWQSLLEDVRKAAGTLAAGTDLVRYVEQMGGPSSDLVLIRRKDLWAMTSAVAAMQTVHDHTMDRLHHLEEATGEQWYGRGRELLRHA